ncbi:hypothetical protein F7308_1926 [Francisella salina]|uniref:Uncharacterized protein n=1 Tax=Francisella salina TaxID=573569 RepID=A0ABM5MC82_FRAST|nr:hypothetical protein F7308_1926 [Francisella salina]
MGSFIKTILKLIYIFFSSKLNLLLEKQQSILRCITDNISWGE